MANGDSIGIVIIDDDELVRRWLCLIFRSQPDIKVLGEAADGVDGVALVRRMKPKVIVTDVRMEAMDGLEATRQILASEPAARVIVLTTFGHDACLFEALCAGASGFLLKSATAEEIVAGVRLVASGGGLLSPDLTRRLVSAFARPTEPATDACPLPSDVTAREREVLHAVGQGLSNSEIAQRLHMSLPTAKTHVSRSLTKLGARDRAQLVIAAYEHGLAGGGGESRR